MEPKIGSGSARRKKKEERKGEDPGLQEAYVNRDPGDTNNTIFELLIFVTQHSNF